MDVIVVNRGSSGIKLACYQGGDPERRLWREVLSSGDGPVLQAVLAKLAEVARASDGVVAVGHRFVHGGPVHHRPVRLNAALFGELRSCEEFDPLHLPWALDLAEAIAHRFPGWPQVACFDTDFFWQLPARSRRLPLPRRYEEAGVRRYGFHGLSYQYLLERIGQIGDPGEAFGRLVLAHLGSGVSLAAVDGGKPIDTTMGCTPTGGIPMSTRSGDIDPGMLPFLARREGLGAEDLARFCARECGLRGVAETTGDLAELLAAEAGDRRAAEAVELFCFSVRKAIGAAAAALGGIDELVFTGGIGEHQPSVRARICAGLEFLGLTVDPAANAAGRSIISPIDKRLIRVIRTDEEKIVARSVRLHLAL